MKNRELLRTFFSSFVITLVVFCFIMSFMWVDLKANRNGFSGFFPSLNIEQVEPLIYKLNTATKQYNLDFTTAEQIAEKLQKAEAWVLPEKWRVFSRASLYIKNRLEAHKIYRREQEFYKNAGLV